MICMNAHVIARVICIYPLHCCHVGLCLHHKLSTMHGPWLSHCTSPWLCMNCWKSSKHLYIGACCCPQEAVLCPSTTWLDWPTLQDKRCVKNSPTCCALLNVGFMAILRRTDCFILIWTCNAVLAVSRNCHFSKLSRLQNETDKKQERSFIFAAMNMCSKRCLLSCMVGLIQLPDSTRVICFQGYGPCGCQG